MQITKAATAPITLTLAQATQAFEDWETDYRANPENFFTADETAATEVATVSESRAICFMAFLRQRQGGAGVMGQTQVIEAMLNRGRTRMVQAVLNDEELANAQKMHNFWHGFADCAAALLNGQAEVMALHDQSSIQQSAVQTALARLPDHCERLSFADMKRLVRSEGVDLASDAVSSSNIDAVAQLQDGVRTVIKFDDKHAVAGVDVQDGGSVHECLPVACAIVDQGGAA